MPEDFVQMPPNSTGAKTRTRSRIVGANTVHEPYTIIQPERLVTAEVGVSTFRTIGNAAVSQNIFTLENGVSSPVLVGIRRLTLQMDATAVLTVVTPQVKVWRITTLPTGGTALTKIVFDSGETSNALAVARAATASDGGAATTITATPPAGSAFWQQYLWRQATAVGQLVTSDESLVPIICDDTPFVLRANQAVLVQIVASVATSNPATNNYIVNCMWEEYTLP